MVGFMLEFKRKYNSGATTRHSELVPIGLVDVQRVHIFGGNKGIDDTPRSNFELVATQILPPRASANFPAPVNDVSMTTWTTFGCVDEIKTSNRRCPKWTMDYIRRMVAVGYLEDAAVAIVQLKRDAPNFGIGLRPSAARQSRAVLQ
jgi:hypothetical protein